MSLSSTDAGAVVAQLELLDTVVLPAVLGHWDPPTTDGDLLDRAALSRRCALVRDALVHTDPGADTHLLLDAASMACDTTAVAVHTGTAGQMFHRAAARCAAAAADHRDLLGLDDAQVLALVLRSAGLGATDADVAAQVATS